jgi:small subunit ribosomal protein S20
LANTKSAEKRARQAVKSYARNRWYRGRARTYVKRARGFIESGEVKEAQEAVQWACRALDIAARKGAIHANNAARRKSRLMTALNKAQAA